MSTEQSTPFVVWDKNATTHEFVGPFPDEAAAKVWIAQAQEFTPDGAIVPEDIDLFPLTTPEVALGQIRQANQ